MNKAIFPQALSLEEYLRKMSEKPWTFGWDALVVFDRYKTNVLLMQEYIDRLGTDTSFPVFEDSEIDVAEGIKHALLGLTVDKPRLSFEAASIALSKAAVTMRMVGGKQMQLNESIHDGKPVKVVTRLSTLNAVVGPSLIFDSKLATAAGSVGEDGAVVLELFMDENGDGQPDIVYRFTGVETEFERLKLGAHLGQLMGKWGPELTRLKLSELRDTEDAVMHPERFGIRTHAAPGAQVRGAQNYGDGAVVLFVAMKDSPNGSYPADDADMLYMLPASLDNFSSNLILAQKFMWHKVILPEISKVEWLTKLKMEDREIPGSLHRQLIATADSLSINLHYEVPLHVVRVPLLTYNYWGEKPARFYTDNNKLKFEYKPDPVRLDCFTGTRDHPADGFQGFSFIAEPNLILEVVFDFVIDNEGEKPVVKLVVESQKASFSVGIPRGQLPDGLRQRAYERMNRFNDMFLGPIEGLVNEVSKIGATIDAFRLNNLLFRGDNVVTPENLNLPGDLTVLGQLSPERTDLVIEPVEVVVAGGGSLQFKASLLGDTNWTVANVDGDAGDPGTIDPFTGLYKAPSPESLRDSGFRRVVVTATRGNKVSKAMVSLVESSVSVYPSVVVVALGSTHSLVAGEVDGASLTWALDDETLGSIALDPDKDPTMQDGYKFTAATSLPDPVSSDPVNFYASRLAEVKVSTVTGGTRTIDVLVTGNKSGSYWLEASANGAGVKLTFYRTTRMNPKEEVPAADTHWHKYKGDGTFVNGVYTPKAGSAEQYAIVTAFYDDDESSDRYAYMIIPIPFVSSQRFVALLGTHPEQ
ncbi:hypothetical protein [Pseudomonas putida]|uniref:hypothetical protein n=1 Tax=Pseudomonas putida TaxID=303 RepID=UPI002168ED45|nr:hypothetical protein [Pseudomonas putida]MCS4065535.1 hypothetical protein [Pseudomonas putida]